MNRNKILLATLCLLTITPAIKQFEATATQIQMTQQEAVAAEKKITQAVKEAIEEFKQQPIIEIKDITTGLTIGKFYKLCSDEEVQYVEQTDKTQKNPANIKCEISKQQLESANIKAKIIDMNYQIQLNYRKDATKSYCEKAQTIQDNGSAQYGNRIVDGLRKAMLDQFEYQSKISHCQKLIKFIEESVIKAITNDLISNQSSYDDFAARIMALEIKKIDPGSLGSEFQDKIGRITDILGNYSIIPLEQAILLESIGIEAKEIVPAKTQNIKVSDQLKQEYFEKLKAVSQPVTVGTTQQEKENKQTEFQANREKLLKNIKEVVLDKINGKLYDFLEKIKQLKIPQIDKATSINLFTIDDKDVTIIKEGDSLVSIVLPNVSLAYFPMEDKFMNMKKLMAVALASAVMLTANVDASTGKLTTDMNALTGKTEAKEAGIVATEIAIDTQKTLSIFPQFTNKNKNKIASALEEYVHYISDVFVQYAAKDETRLGKALVVLLNDAKAKDPQTIDKTVKSLKDIKAIIGKDLNTLNQKEADDAVKALQQLENLTKVADYGFNDQDQFVISAIKGIHPKAVGDDGYAANDAGVLQEFKNAFKETVELLKTKLVKEVTAAQYMGKGKFEQECADLIQTPAGTAIVDLFKANIKAGNETANTEDEAYKQMAAAVRAEFKTYSDLSDDLAEVIEKMKKNTVLNQMLEDKFKAETSVKFKEFLEGMKAFTGIDPNQLAQAQQEKADAEAERDVAKAEAEKVQKELDGLNDLFDDKTKTFLGTTDSTDVKESINAINEMLKQQELLLERVIGNLSNSQAPTILKKMNNKIKAYNLEVKELATGKMYTQKEMDEALIQAAGNAKQQSIPNNAINAVKKIVVPSGKLLTAEHIEQTYKDLYKDVLMKVNSNGQNNELEHVSGGTKKEHYTQTGKDFLGLK